MSTTTTISTTAVPESINTKCITATFKQNKALSSTVDEVLKTQGVSWSVRTALKYAPMSVQIRFYITDDGIEHLDIDQLLPAGVKSDEPRTLDFKNVRNCRRYLVQWLQDLRE